MNATFKPRQCHYNAQSDWRKPSEWREGMFHCWGTTNESIEITMPSPCAVVEDLASGEIFEVCVHRVRFIPPRQPSTPGAPT